MSRCTDAGAWPMEHRCVGGVDQSSVVAGLVVGCVDRFRFGGAVFGAGTP